MRAIAFVLGALVASAASGAPANERPLVVLETDVSAPPGVAWPEAEQRAIAELGAVGLAVVRVNAAPLDRQDPFTTLGVLARERHAVAALRIRRLDRSGVDLWLVEEVTGKASHRRVSTKDLPSSEAVALVALSVVELLNASLLELRAGHSSRGTAPPTPAVLQIVDRALDVPGRTYRFALRGGAGVVGSPGGLDLMAGPSLAAGWGFTESFALEADVMGSVVESTVDGEAGTARVRLGFGRLALLFRAPVSDRVELQLGAGGGAVAAWISGEPRDRYVAHSDTTTVALTSILAGMAARLSDALRIRVAFGASLALPALAVDLAGRSAASAGTPLLDGNVGLEWVSLSERSPQ